MSDPAVLFVKPKAISSRDKKALQAVGVVVVEVADPASVKFLRPSAELSGSDLLRAAAKAIASTKYQQDAREVFGRVVCEAIADLPSPSPSPPGPQENTR